MTDEQMDARLRTAGAQWRSAAPEQPDVRTVGPAAPRRHWWLLASAAVLIGLLVAGAVKLSTFGDPARRSGGPAIGNATWHARSFSAGPSHELVSLSGAANLTFTAGRIKGTDGCNAIDATARVDTDTIVIGNYAQTQIGCDGAEFVDRVMIGTVRYSVTSRALVITKDGVGTLFLSRGPARMSSPTVPLVGAWVLTGTQTTSKDGGTVSGSSISPTGDSLQLTISSSGVYTLSLRCLRIQGHLDSRRTRIVNVKHEGIRCHVSRSVGQQEGFLQTTVTYGATLKIESSSLRITKGTRAAIFERT